MFINTLPYLIKIDNLLLRAFQGAVGNYYYRIFSQVSSWITTLNVEGIIPNSPGRLALDELSEASNDVVKKLDISFNLLRWVFVNVWWHNPSPCSDCGDTTVGWHARVYLKLRWAWHLGFFINSVHIFSRQKMICFSGLQEPPTIFFHFWHVWFTMIFESRETTWTSKSETPVVRRRLTQSQKFIRMLWPMRIW